MKLHIDRHHIEPMIAEFPRLAFVQEQLRFGNRVELSFGQMQAEELDYLQGLYAQGGQELRARGAQIATLRKVIGAGGKRFEADELEMAVPAIARYLAEDSQRGWVFSATITYVCVRPGTTESMVVPDDVRAALGPAPRVEP